ncbi:MAG TPA: ATP-dependent helicase, partial [Thermoguttaceae bacterium]|nr:ATP-dependent helicase [Thermoguttaceae bacterium]
TNEQPRVFETELRQADVPYVLVGGMSFFDRKEVRDILAYLKLLVNPRDEVSLLRIINTPPRGIGQTTVTRLMEHAVEQGEPVWNVLTTAGRRGVVSPAAMEAIDGFRTLIETHRARMSKQSPEDLVRGIVRQTNYRDELTRLYPDTDEQESRWNAVEEVVNAVATYTSRAGKPTLSGFLQDVALAGPDDQDDKETQLERNAVALMTMHSAKGLEFPEVYMVGMEEGLLPHRRSVEAAGPAIDEERRLCYVGVTRAQRRLTLSMALNRLKWGRLRPTDPSRFLYEITGQADNPNYVATTQGSKRPTAKRPTATKKKATAKPVKKRTPKKKGSAAASRKPGR